MARYLGPKCKLCRRERNKLFLKGERCFTAKCSISKRKYPPGLHGPSQQRGSARMTEYGEQLRAKQVAKRIYGILERQFANYFKEASKAKGKTGSVLINLLERRLDNVVYRSGLVDARSKARQVVTHSLFKVNNHIVDVPSYRVKVGDIIQVKSNKKNSEIVKAFQAKKVAKNLPSWLQVDPAKGEIKILSNPTKDDLVEKIDERSIIEFYSRKQ